jgi:two-component system, LytTR family, sensor kinase
LETSKLKLGSFLSTYIIWWLVWTLLHTLVVSYSSEFSWWIATQDAIITNVVLSLAGYEMIIIMRYYQPRPGLRIIWSIGLTIFCMAVVQWLLNQALESYPEYLLYMRKWIVVRALFSWLMISFITVISWMYFYMQEQQEAQLRAANTEKLARESELTTLRQQLQPHFLFNSLNSISALAGSRPEEARKMIQQLSDFLRGTIKRDNQQHISLEEELSHLQLYLEIEKVRFGHRLQTAVTFEETAKALQVPSLLLQPIVENAIKFGLYDTTGEILIRIEAKNEINQLLIIVTNPYDPETTQVRTGTGFGLSSVQRRLYLLYGRNDLLTTHQQDAIFTTRVLIPQSL